MTPIQRFRYQVRQDLKMQIFIHQKVKLLLKRNHSLLESEFGFLLPFGQVSWLQSSHDLNKEIISARLDYLTNSADGRKKYETRTLYDAVFFNLHKGLALSHSTWDGYVHLASRYSHKRLSFDSLYRERLLRPREFIRLRSDQE